jgi:hypothetical protein
VDIYGPQLLPSGLWFCKLTETLGDKCKVRRITNENSFDALRSAIIVVEGIVKGVTSDSKSPGDWLVDGHSSWSWLGYDQYNHPYKD